MATKAIQQFILINERRMSICLCKCNLWPIVDPIRIMGDERGVPDSLARISVGALICSRLRMIDITLREHVLLLHVIEGETNMRSHGGIFFTYRDGAFQPYDGLMHESCLAHVKTFFLRLEGLFRLTPCTTPRTPDGIVRVLLELPTQEPSVQQFIGKLEDVSVNANLKALLLRIS